MSKIIHETVNLLNSQRYLKINKLFNCGVNVMTSLHKCDYIDLSDDFINYNYKSSSKVP